MTQKEIKDKIADYKKRLDNKSIKEIPSAVRKIESEIAKYESMLEDEKESSETIKVYVKNLKDKGLVDATWFPSEKSYYVKFKDGSDGYFEKKDLILPSVLSNKKPKKDSKIKTETKKYEYDCEELISKAKERHEKSKERAKVESKKSEVVKAKEKIDRTHEQIEHKIEKGEFTKAQIQKLIVETTELLKMLEKAISKFD